MENRPKDLTFDVLSTFMSEVSAIMNTRHRNTWPVGIIKEVLPSKDDVIRKVMVTVVRNSYVRPFTELIHLLDCE